MERRGRPSRGRRDAATRVLDDMELEKLDVNQEEEH